MSVNSDDPAAAMGEGDAPHGVRPGAERTPFRHGGNPFGKHRMELMPTGRPPAVEREMQPVQVLLGTIPSLRYATLSGLRALAAVTEREPIAHGDVILRQGEQSDDVFYIVLGLFDVLASHFGNVPELLRTLRPGDSFGELGVLYDVPRTATVRCIASGEVLRIPGEGFLDALDSRG